MLKELPGEPQGFPKESRVHSGWCLSIGEGETIRKKASKQQIEKDKESQEMKQREKERTEREREQREEREEREERGEREEK